MSSGMLLDLNLSLHQSTSPSPTRHQDTAPASPPDRKFVVDLTKIPSSVEFEDGGSQNSTLSTLTRKRTHPEAEETHFLVPASSGRIDQASPSPSPSPRGACGGVSDEELDGDNSRKKLRLSREQSLLLEDTFKDHNTLNPRQKQALAKQLGLSARQVEVWFQNRRARTKLKQTEAECEYMKRNCETLMDHVRRLQKEVNELRSLKLAPQIYMQMPQATTLTLCPSCERVGIPTLTTNPPVNASCVGVVDCSNLGRVGSVSGNIWASSNQMNHKPF